MSATGRNPRGGDGVDFFPTSEWVTHRFLDRAGKRGVPMGGVMLEPCAGDGAIIKAYNSHPFVGNEQRVWTACELRSECVDALSPLARKIYIGDFLRNAERLALSGIRFNVSATNPPFNDAEAIIRASVSISDWTVMLLRTNFLGGEDRAAGFYKDVGMPDIYVLPNRPSFAASVSCSRKKEGCDFHVLLPLTEDVPKICAKCGAKTKVTRSDATEYGWFVWGPHSIGAVRGSHEILDITPLDIRKNHAAVVVNDSADLILDGGEGPGSTFVSPRQP